MSAVHRQEAGVLLAHLFGKRIRLGDAVIQIQKLFNQAELSAYRQGMTDAAEICRNPKLTLEGEITADKILTTRDNKKEL